MNFSFINEIILSVLLGVVQGFAEFLPISSTAHLRLLSSALLQGRDIGLVTSNIIQFGTTIAIIQYFWADLSKYFYRLINLIKNPNQRDIFVDHVKSWWNGTFRELRHTPNLHLDIEIIQIIVGSIPIMVLGFTLRNFAEEYRNLTDIAYFLLAGSGLMWLAEYIHNKVKNHPEEKEEKKSVIFTKGEVILVGFFQFLAIFPGISRSGATASGALIVGRPRAEAIRFSFLLSIPALIAASLLDLFKALVEILRGNIAFLPSATNWNTNNVNISIFSLAISFILSYIVGWACLSWLINFLTKRTFYPFIWYRIGLAVVLLSLVALKLA